MKQLFFFLYLLIGLLNNSYLLSFPYVNNINQIQSVQNKSKKALFNNFNSTNELMARKLLVSDEENHNPEGSNKLR
jgi:pterin-4a-carbinolamine dehydratase